MGPYEITYPGGSVEHWNEQTGEFWLRLLSNHFTHNIWLNPQPHTYWEYHHSIHIIRDIMDDKMYPLTLDGLGQGIAKLLQN